MSKLRCHISISLDGFVAGPNQSEENPLGFAGYPTLRLMALAETGTRGLLGATLGSASDQDEANLARRLLPLLRPGMLLRADRRESAQW